MAHSPILAILLYGEPGSGRNALTEEKYRDLADAFISHGFTVESVIYADGAADALKERLISFDAVLVWVNPVEQGNDRRRLDIMLTEIADNGCFVSTHPEVILKMGTKDILYKTRDMEWSNNVELYTSFDQFLSSFPGSLKTGKPRVLKQYRGNGGNGVFKVCAGPDNRFTVTHVEAGNEKMTLTEDEFFEKFRPFFSNKGLLIDQAWNENITNGMVRCYVSGNKVAGFGYQEINALYELNGTYFPPGKRHYYTENCSLFGDLKEIMETSWIPELQEKLKIPDDRMPVIWDADFFINSFIGSSAIGKYTLCEINVSCVSPFPPSAIRFIVKEISDRIQYQQDGLS